jgi:hypothetical protein
VDTHSEAGPVAAAGGNDAAGDRDTAGDRGRSGPLGPALAGAIADYNAALARAADAETALEVAQREVAGARARLTALAAGARITGAKALLAVPDAEDVDDAG